MADYIEVVLTIDPFDPWSDLISQDLADLGFESFDRQKDILKAYVREDIFVEEQMISVLEGYSNMASSHFETRHIESVNWNKEWESNFEPVRIDNDVYVRAPFHKKMPNIKHEILLTPKMSFGTGHHATTYMMMKEMLGLDLKGKKVLDVGCGTAILSILAEQLGAESVLAIDNDDWSEMNAKENIVINNSKNINVENAEISDVDENPFNVILANINRNVIVEDLHAYAHRMKEDAHLLLSGFQQADVDIIEGLAASMNLSLLNSMKEGEWHMLHFVKGRTLD